MNKPMTHSGWAALDCGHKYTRAIGRECCRANSEGLSAKKRIEDSFMSFFSKHER